MATSLFRAIPEQSTLAAVVQIGEWAVEPTANELAGKGQIVHLEPKVMEVLVFLAERAGQVVSREALLSAVWPGTVVGDDALTQAVIKLRKALQDTARSPQYIETISRRGYRLIASVDLGAAGTGLGSATAVPPDRRRLRVAAAAALLALAVGASAFLYVARQQSVLVDSPILGLKEASAQWTALPTIAVTPFETIAADGAETYLALGIAADLTTDLSRLAGIRAISFPQNGPGKDDSALMLARYAISGTVQRTSDMLRVNVRLVDNATKMQVWAERYDRPFSDLMAIQDEIIGRLLKALPIQISDAERQRLAKRYTRNLDAYDFFLRGKAAFLARQPAENRVARAMYQKAIDLDPAFARAYAGLALTHADDYRNHWTEDGQQSQAKALQLAESALRIDPDIPEVYAVLGYAHAMQLDYKNAIKLVEKAIELDRSYADAYAYLGAFHTHSGEPAKAIPLLRTAMRLNPGAGFIYFVVLGRAYLFQGDIQQATINLKEALKRNAADIETRVYMTATLVAAGELEAARWEAGEVLTLQPDFTVREWLQTSPMSDPRQKQHVRTLLAKAGL